MTWRLHFSNQAILRVDLLGGKPALLCVWASRERAAYFDLETGAAAGETIHRPPQVESRQHPRWLEFTAGLTAPNGAFLPVVRAGRSTIYSTDDGKMRLLHTGGNLFLEIEGKEIKLETGGAALFTAVDLDRFLGLIAALDENSKLAVYQQHIRVGLFDIGLRSGPDCRPMLAVAHGGAQIFATDGHEIVVTDSSGIVRRRLTTHYFVGRMACSPNGRLLAVSDGENGVIRVYNGADLAPTHQRYAIDLLSRATQVQLLADMPPLNAAPGALAINNAGTLAFAISGVVCVTRLELMDALPRPQRLL